jgi:hypothetical protein
LKIENSRRVAESRPVCMGLKEATFLATLSSSKNWYNQFWQLLPHTRVREQKTLKVLCFVTCVEDYRKLAQTQLLIPNNPTMQSPLANRNPC